MLKGSLDWYPWSTPNQPLNWVSIKYFDQLSNAHAFSTNDPVSFVFISPCLAPHLSYGHSWVRIAVATIIFPQTETQEQEGEETPEASDEKVCFFLFQGKKKKDVC